MLRKQIKNLIVYSLLLLPCVMQAQDDVTNAFDDLKRQGTVNEQDSEMRRVASPDAVKRLLQEHPEAGYFCFTEDRAHDIRMTDAVPQRWVERPAHERTKFKSDCLPGEFYTWQVGLFAPYKTISDVSVSFADWKNEKGQKIPAAAFRCFNLGGVDTDGQSFRKTVNISKGSVQALWIGLDVPVSASGVYKGNVTVKAVGAKPVEIACELAVQGSPVSNHGDDEGWRKTRLRWLDSSIGNDDEPTAPYIPVKLQKQTVSWLGGEMELSKEGLPKSLFTCYDPSNQLSGQSRNQILADAMRFVIETEAGEEVLKPGSLRITERNNAAVSWMATQKNRHFEVQCTGEFGFDGLVDYRLQVKSLSDIKVKDIRLMVPYTAYAAKYMMGLGHKGGLRPDSTIYWRWNVEKHQDKIWMGNVNAGLNFCFKDENYKRPLVNIYYGLGKLKLPVSWGNANRGGIDIGPDKEGTVRMTVYSGERAMQKGDVLHYNFNMLVTPVKPLNLREMAEKHFYHSNSDVSAGYIPAALKAGANMINVHHKKDIYPFINYPYYDEAIPDLKCFISDAHSKNLDVRLYYTTRELTVKIPELWALRSLGDEVIHDAQTWERVQELRKRRPYPDPSEWSA